MLAPQQEEARSRPRGVFGKKNLVDTEAVEKRVVLALQPCSLVAVVAVQCRGSGAWRCRPGDGTSFARFPQTNYRERLRGVLLEVRRGWFAEAIVAVGFNMPVAAREQQHPHEAMHVARKTTFSGVHQALSDFRFYGHANLEGVRPAC